MNLKEYTQLVNEIQIGKRLPDAIYVHKECIEHLPDKLVIFLSAIAEKAKVTNGFNVLKFGRRGLKVSFLNYPDFFEAPHPTLAESVSIDIAVGSVRRDDYGKRENPPILHRKEAFLPEGHASRELFASLTVQEEDAGLYESPQTIGFKLNWSQLLKDKGLTYDGHNLVACKEEPQTSKKRAPKFERAKTAITRSELSKPVKRLLEFGQLLKGRSFFDFGCGLGADVIGLTAMGIKAAGWDPSYRPDAPKHPAQVVNLGFVLNVIEDSAERVEVLNAAWALTEGVLSVSTLVEGREYYKEARTYGDGVVTGRNTFQKFFNQSELQSLIEDSLGVDAAPVEIGLFFVFRDSAAHQDFVASRSRRAIDWETASHTLRALRPKRPSLQLAYTENRELLDLFWKRTLTLGRLPAEDEFEGLHRVREVCGSIPRALGLFLEDGGDEDLERMRQQRREDLMVYLTNGEFAKRRPPLSGFSASLKRDIKAFFGSYATACESAREILFAAGDPGELALAVDELEFGWREAIEEHFSIHHCLLDKLPPILRVYVECAKRLVGVVDEADLIKLHLRSGKVTLLYYDDFKNRGLPELTTRIKIDIGNLFVRVFDYSTNEHKQLLYFKERFLPKGYPGIREIVGFGKKLRNLGLAPDALGPNDCDAPTPVMLAALLREKGIQA